MTGRAPLVRFQTVLVALLAGSVVWFSGHPLDTGNAPTTPEPTTIVLPTSTAVNTPSAFPSSEPTVEPTDSPAPTEMIEPTPEETPRPEPPDTGQERSLIVDRGPSDRIEVALTFDAGEGAGHTAEILDLLAEYGLKGSFGVTGQWAEQNPDLMRRILDEGHQIINHTYDHRSYTGVSTGLEPLTPEEFEEEVTRTEAIIEDVTGGYVSKPFFRFPYGDYDTTALDALGELGYSYTMWWSCDTLGWMGKSPQEIVELCGPNTEKGGPGAIILMHVADDNDWDALEPLIQAYADEEYAFVTLEEMIQP